MTDKWLSLFGLLEKGRNIGLPGSIVLPGYVAEQERDINNLIAPLVKGAQDDAGECQIMGAETNEPSDADAGRSNAPVVEPSKVCNLTCQLREERNLHIISVGGKLLRSMSLLSLPLTKSCLPNV